MSKISLFFFMLVLHSFYCCKHKEDVCANTPKPSITFYENIGDLSRTDTVLAQALVQFTAPDGFDSYEWKIAYDDRTFNGKKISLRFMEGDLGTFPVRLVTKRAPNTDCNPNDTGIDTVTKNITVVKPEQAKIAGKYKGRALNSQETEYIVEVKVIKNPVYINKFTLAMSSVTPECNKTYDTVEAYRMVACYPERAYAGAGCHVQWAWAHLNDSDPSGNTFIMEYQKQDQNPPYIRTTHLFVGKRVP